MVFLKKNGFVVGFLVSMWGAMSTCTALAETTQFNRVEIDYPRDECSFKYSSIDFCDKKHIDKYETALKGDPVNFNHHYILLPNREWNDSDEQSLVAIDKNTGIVYPVPIDSFFEFSEGKDKGRKPILTFAIASDEVCIRGSILVYRATETGKFCFKLQGKKFIGYHTTYMGHDQP